MERKTSPQITQALLNSCATQLSPWFITGFAVFIFIFIKIKIKNAEASFSILIQHDTKFNTNWRVKAIFSIGLHIKDFVLLESLKQTLGVGKIHKHGKRSVQFRVESIKELQVIVNHFDKYKISQSS